MCGIFGLACFNFPLDLRQLVQVLINGLQRLEYRGYDSAGLCVVENGSPVIIKSTGNVAKLEIKAEEQLGSKVKTSPVSASVGIAHTRWATHGDVCEKNAHPHASGSQDFVIVHNGIVTNYLELKNLLLAKGIQVVSDTDTEIVAALTLYLYQDSVSAGKNPNFVQLVMEVMDLLEGAYSFLFQSKHFPNQLVGCKRGSPLLVGILRDGQESCHELNEHASRPTRFFFASDSTAIVEHTRDVIFLEDDDVAYVENGLLHFFNKAKNVDYNKVRPELRSVNQLQVELESISKGNFPHFMMKEIFEQPESITNSMRGRLNFSTEQVLLGGFQQNLHLLRTARRLIFISCGTSLNACLAVRPLFDELSGLPVAVENASDFLDRSPAIFRDDVCIFVSQSGETADTLRSLEYCKTRGAVLVGFVNTVGSSISRLTDFGAHLNCGVEIGVASTKAYTAQIITMVLLTLVISADSVSLQPRRKELFTALSQLPGLISKCLHDVNSVVQAIAVRLRDAKSVLVLGRGYHYATCIEAALKIKELTYIHTEGINSGELKHGPLALIDENIPVIMCSTKDSLIGRNRSAIQQVRARKGRPIVIMSDNDEEIVALADDVIKVPQTLDCLQSIINIIPMQLLAYHLAVLKGNNVDCPRNLAKSVTTQ